MVSGKGGVGKTNIALNLGFALNEMGHTLVLLDADLGLANLDVLLGLSPEKNIQDLIAGEDAANVVVPLTENGFVFLPSASGVAELVEMDEDIQGVLLDKLDGLFHQYDFLILDLGAGISPTVLSFAAMPQERVVIITPEPTSLTDSYALSKSSTPSVRSRTSMSSSTWPNQPRKPGSPSTAWPRPATTS